MTEIFDWKVQNNRISCLFSLEYHTYPSWLVILLIEENKFLVDQRVEIREKSEIIAWVGIFSVFKQQQKRETGYWRSKTMIN